jgi:hypothetical protein
VQSEVIDQAIGKERTVLPPPAVRGERHNTQRDLDGKKLSRYYQLSKSLSIICPKMMTSLSTIGPHSSTKMFPKGVATKGGWWLFKGS